MSAEPDPDAPAEAPSAPPSPAPDAAADATELDLPLRPPIRESPVSIVVPIVSLSPSPDQVAARWRPLLEKLPAESCLIPVYDGNVGLETAIIPATRIVQHMTPLGRGGCLETGLAFVDTPLVLAVDDDESFDPLECLTLWESIDQVDLVCACRSIGPTPWPLAMLDRAKWLLGRVLLGYEPDPRVGWPGHRGDLRRRIARRGFGVPVADPLAGMILARTAAIRGFPIQSRGSFAWTEIIAKANHTECLLTDMPIAMTKPVTLDADFFADVGRLFAHPDFGPPRS